MKINIRITFLLMTLTLIFSSGCSYIKIVNPRADQQSMGTPHDLVVAHTGCGSVHGGSFRARLNGTDITANFIYDSRDETWTAIRYNLPVGRHTLSVSADISPGSWCFEGTGTDSRDFTVISNCPPGSYCAYFLDNPRIADITIHAFDTETLAFFWDYINQLEETGVITIEEPEAWRTCQESDSCSTVIWLTPIEVKRIHAAKSAHAVWLDKNKLLPWELYDYTDEELRGLFDKELLFDGSVDSVYFYSIVDYSPSDIYRYALDHGLVGTGIMNTVYLVLNDLRTTDNHLGFIHGSTNDGEELYKAHTLYNALTECFPRPDGCVRKSYQGCHSMSRIIVGLLRSLNIPGHTTSNGEWYYDGHSSVVWPALQRVMPHGDDIYTALLKATPNEEFLVPMSFYEETRNTSVCGANKGCLSRRHHILMAIKYPTDWVRERCCRPSNYGYTSCEAYLSSEFGDFLTAEELDSAITTYSSLCR
jgi:hypothetical protein